MSVKKITKKEPVKAEKPINLEQHRDGYFTAEVHVGKKITKIRGQIFEDSGDMYLANCQYGDEVDDCDSEMANAGYSKQIHLRHINDDNVNDRVYLEGENVFDFKIVKDKRIIKIIDADKLPEIAGFRSVVDEYGIVKFGCGAIEFDIDSVEMWSNMKRALEEFSGDNIELFTEMNSKIIGQISVSQLGDIDPDDVDEIIRKSKLN